MEQTKFNTENIQCKGCSEFKHSSNFYTGKSKCKSCLKGDRAVREGKNFTNVDNEILELRQQKDIIEQKINQLLGVKKGLFGNFQQNTSYNTQQSFINLETNSSNNSFKRL